MAIAAAWKAFCKALAVKASKPLTKAELKAAEAKLGGALPGSLRELYLAANGGKSRHPEAALQILTLKSALRYGRVPGFFASSWRLWAVAEGEDSNPLCVCCQSPLAGYLVLVSHDDEPRLLFRSLENFLRAATARFAAQGQCELGELAGDFAGPARTKQDRAIAKRLAALVRKQALLSEQECTDALRFACELFADEDQAAIQQLADLGDEYVGEQVAARLKRIPGAAARKASRGAAETFDV